MPFVDSLHIPDQNFAILEEANQLTLAQIDGVFGKALQLAGEVLCAFRGVRRDAVDNQVAQAIQRDFVKRLRLTFTPSHHSLSNGIFSRRDMFNTELCSVTPRLDKISP